jgi:UDP-N-acetyl-D-mannosaminuronic acid dehydrogenase
MGLGNIGLPVIQHVSKIYKQTVGYDIAQSAVNAAIQVGVTASTELAYADVYIIAVNTWYHDGCPNMNAVEDCVQRISKLNPNALICFESTLAKGTVRSLSKKYNLSNLAVCPHRWWKEQEDKYGVVQLRVLGTLNPESQKNAVAFYNSISVPLHIVSSLEIAELSKIVENSYYYLRIAYAEELKLLCDANDIDFDELRNAANTKWNVDMAEARDGIGGECLPKDIQLLINTYPQASLLKGAVTADINYRTKLSKKY